MSEWIKVEDRLPAQGQCVKFICSEGVCFGHYLNGFQSRGVDCNTVSWWMPQEIPTFDEATLIRATDTGMTMYHLGYADGVRDSKKCS